jgi:hypothetical protein
VRRQLTVPYSPQQNGVVERRNQTVVGTARCLLKSKGLTGWFWGEAMATAVYLLNRSPTRSLEGRTPFEAWYEKKPGVQHLRTFECLVHVKDTMPNLKKLDDKSKLMIFISYEPGSKAYHVYNPLTKKVHVTRDVVFAEQEQWNWSVEAGHEPTDGDDTFTVETEYSTAVQGVPAGDHIPEAPEIGGMAGTPERAASPMPPLFSSAPVSAVESAAGVGDQGEQPGSPLGIREDDLDAYHEEDDPMQVRRVDDIPGPASPCGLAQQVLTQELYAVSSDEPNSFEEAEQDPCWRWAMLEEMKVIEDNDTWHLADLP